TYSNTQKATDKITTFNDGSRQPYQSTFDPSSTLDSSGSLDVTKVAGTDHFQRTGGQTATYSDVIPNTSGSYTVDEISIPSGYRQIGRASCRESAYNAAADAAGKYTGL